MVEDPGHFDLVHESELRSFFCRIRMLDALESGSLRCAACNAVMTLENFAAVTRQEGDLLFLCKKPHLPEESIGA